MKIKIIKICCLLSYLAALTVNAQKVFLCGNDEDGCDIKNPSSCVCILEDLINANKPYCLNFHHNGKVSCDQLYNKKSCLSNNWFNNEKNCVAIAVQSVLKPSCHIENTNFCIKNKIQIIESSDLNPQTSKIISINPKLLQWNSNQFVLK
jgi:hypothetical protein